MDNSSERYYLIKFRQKFINDVFYLQTALDDVGKCHDARDRANLIRVTKDLINSIKDEVIYDFDARLRDDEIAKSLGVLVNLHPAATGNHAVQGKENK